MSPFFAQLKLPKTQYVSHFWPPRGGSPIRPLLSFQSLGLKTHQDSPKTPHRPAKGAPRTSKTPQRCPKDPPKGYPEANFCFRVFLAPSGSKNLFPEPKTHQRYVTKGASRAAKSLRGPEPKYHKKIFVVFWPPLCLSNIMYFEGAKILPRLLCSILAPVLFVKHYVFRFVVFWTPPFL